MTRKDFNLIAKTIRILDVDAATRAHIANVFAASLSTTNPRFDRDRFVAATVSKNPIKAMREAA